MSNTEVATVDPSQLAVEGDNTIAVHQSLAVSLARAEVDQQIATARAMPRHISRAIANIETLATLDEETAAECIYALPRGGKSIRGPSIRFAEIVASQWGNCRIGARVVHVDRIEKYVEAEGVFHDLETNVAQTARVRRTIQAKRGKGIDDDMIALAGAAACSIARRNAILAGVPKGVARKGYVAVENVLRGDVKTLSERRAQAIKAFGVLGVTPDRLFAALGVIGEADITLDHLLTLTGVRSAIKNGEMTVDEAFPPVAKPGEQRPKDLAAALDKISGVKPTETVDPATGEVKDKPAADKSAEEPAGQGKTDSVEATATEAGKGADGSPQGPQEGAAPEPTAGAALTDAKAAALADLLETGAGRAEGGMKPLLAFLNELEPEQRDSLPKATVDAWRKTARAADAATKGGQP